MLEVVHMVKLRHENVLTLNGISFKFGPLTLVTPWMEHSNARDRLTKLKGDSRRSRPLYCRSNKWVNSIVLL